MIQPILTRFSVFTEEEVHWLWGQLTGGKFGAPSHPLIAELEEAWNPSRLVPRVMTLDHPRWDLFVTRLGGPEGVNWSDEGWDCTSTMERPKATAILSDMGFNEEEVAESFEYFNQHGGYCDCEILLNVDSLRYDEDDEDESEEAS